MHSFIYSLLIVCEWSICIHVDAVLITTFSTWRCYCSFVQCTNYDAIVKLLLMYYTARKGRMFDWQKKHASRNCSSLSRPYDKYVITWNDPLKWFVYNQRPSIYRIYFVFKKVWRNLRIVKCHASHPKTKTIITFSIRTRPRNWLVSVAKILRIRVWHPRTCVFMRRIQG